MRRISSKHFAKEWLLPRIFQLLSQNFMHIINSPLQLSSFPPISPYSSFYGITIRNAENFIITELNEYFQSKVKRMISRLDKKKKKKWNLRESRKIKLFKNPLFPFKLFIAVKKVVSGT